MATVKEIKTFIAGENLAAHRRVKVMTASQSVVRLQVMRMLFILAIYFSSKIALAARPTCVI